MRFGRFLRLAIFTVSSLAPFLGLGRSQNAQHDECTKTAHLQTYSNAVFVEQAGDVVGDELAFQQSKGHSIVALLYIYEGVPNEDGIKVSGKISDDGKVRMEGNWVQHLIAEPSKKELVETRPVEISGTLNSKQFRGTIEISGMAKRVTLKRVTRIWMCKR